MTGVLSYIINNVCAAAFQCHPDGCPMVLYAPQHQVLISGGKKGEICIFDVRQRQLRQTFQAHETNVAIRCLALDSGTTPEECFVTGGSDGDIKVSSISVFCTSLVANFMTQRSLDPKPNYEAPHLADLESWLLASQRNLA